MQPQNSSRQIKPTKVNPASVKLRVSGLLKSIQSVRKNRRIDPLLRHSPQYAGNPVPLHGCGDACGFEAPHKTP
jgi:hypothetical protein